MGQRGTAGGSGAGLCSQLQPRGQKEAAASIFEEEIPLSEAWCSLFSCPSSLTLSIHTRGDLTWLETANKLVLHPEQGLGVPDHQKPAVSAAAPQNFNSRIAWIDPLWQVKAPP